MQVSDPKRQLEEKVEVLKLQSKEKVRENFTQLPRHLIEAFLGIEQKEEKNKPKNFTPFDQKIRDQLGEEFKDQDSDELEEARDTISAIKRQLDYVRKEEEEAREYFKKKDEERKKADEKERQIKELEEQRKQEQTAAASAGEPSTKQKRGSLFARKKPKKTAENAVAFGKQ